MENIRIRLRRIIVLAAMVMFLCAPSVFAAKNDYFFAFSPTNGTTFMLKTTTLREKDLGPTGRQLDETTTISKITMLQTNEGWDVVYTPLGGEMKRDGKVIRNPVVSLLTNITITLKLDKNGKAKDIIGYEAFTEAIKSKYPPDVSKQIALLINTDTLKQKNMAEWNGRIGDFVGKKISLGDQWEYYAPFSLPNGTKINYKVKIDFKAVEDCGSRKCLRIEQVYDSDAEGVARLVKERTESLNQEAKEGMGRDLPTIEPNGSSIKGKLTRLIDPSTMLIYFEQIERTMTIEMDIPGAGRVPTKMVEKRLYEFEYGNDNAGTPGTSGGPLAP